MTAVEIPAPDPDAAPEALKPLVEGVLGLDPAWFGTRRDPAGQERGVRRAAVLMLFGRHDDRRPGADGPDEGPGLDVLLTERSSTLRSHAGQVAFPGGRVDPGDTGPVHAALREAQEETGLDPAGVVPLAVLPELFIPPTGFLVTPVLAHWADPVPVRAIDPAEVARVVRVPVPVLTDPANRFTVRGPRGHTGPAFRTSGLVIWGFTAGLLSALLQRSGWERPWDGTQVEELEDAWTVARRLHGSPGPAAPDDGDRHHADRNHADRNHGDQYDAELRGERVTDPGGSSHEVGR
ncbi:NUDIX domain-containing protein [Pseudonocardia ammonioxydans]|uniref:NUDIX domain-containing protein n=1 Tax=Pseudonocardia ammonioxydans TaxID=260086 RepID=A0A1I4X4H4_PSUAM|nr:CoA pyrophosphatase [Pseudonocardia ammonioxydans]SFN20824.1 NUDIX domain-containing protein [Pseudonocardia ammonioxydans]